MSEIPCPYAGEAVAHAWHAAEPEDDELVLAHLPDCARCREVVRDVRAVAAEIALAVPPEEPPAALRERILAAVAAEPAPTRDAGAPQHASASPRPRGPGPVSDAPVPAPAGPPDPATPASRTGRSRGTAALLLLTAAVVLGVVLLAGRALLPGQPVSTQATGVPQDPTSLAARAAQVVRDAEAVDPGVRHAVLRDGDGRSVAVALDGTGQASPRVVPLALAPPGPGRTWVLWGTGAGPPTALGAVDRATGRSVGASAPPPGRAWRGFALSEEPSGPVPSRPSDVLALGSVA